MKWTRSVSKYTNKKTGGVRKQIVLPFEIVDCIGNLCEVQYDSDLNRMVIYFSKNYDKKE